MTKLNGTDKRQRVSDAWPELFHYTTVEAFRSIHNSQAFWATHYEDLNDYSELRRFRLVVTDFITPTIRKFFNKRARRDSQFRKAVRDSGGIEVIVRQESAQQLDRLHRNTFSERGLQNTFICSFCAHDPGSYEATHGLLSQWRAYGTGDGVAIVLDTEAIEKKMKQERRIFRHPINHIGDVKYDYKKDARRIKKDFHEVFDRFPEALKAIYSNKRPPYEEMFDHFVQGSTLVKHHGFHEEKEVRIVVSPRPINPRSFFFAPEHDSKPAKTIRYRQRGISEVRYIELFGAENETALPIKRVIVGPSRVQNLNYQMVSDQLQTSGIAVFRSETPFLG